MVAPHRFGQRRIRTSIVVSMLLISSCSAESEPEVAINYAGRADVAAFSDAVVAEHALDPELLVRAARAAHFRQDIIERISKPAEKVWTWGRYRDHLVDEDRISQGAEFWRAHRSTLDRAAAEYGVAPEYVVAVLGIETRYGRIKGGYPVLDALFTLGFDYPPRAEFFRSELTQFLLLVSEEDKDPSEIKGSYAGAMGYGQFISSSYRNYAVDFDDDGVRDIWDNPTDAIGSIANYFEQHGWHDRGLVAEELLVTDEAERLALNEVAQTDLKLTKTIADLRTAGAPVDEEYAPDRIAGVFALETDDGVEYWLVFDNFYAITRYNHSHLYAMAVHQLAQEIKQRL